LTNEKSYNIIIYLVRTVISEITEIAKGDMLLTKEQIEHDAAIFKELEKFDTPTICNAVATYPDRKDQCLGLYHPWNGKWYTDQTLKAHFPKLPPQVGYAVTVVFGLPDPNYDLGHVIAKVCETIDASPKPSVLVAKQDMPDFNKFKNGLLGGCMMSAYKAVGCIAAITDGASRDLQEVEPLGMQYMTTGLVAGHGFYSVVGLNTPVEVCDMYVCPSDIIHLDCNGAVKFPREYLDEVLRRCKVISQIEGNLFKTLQTVKTIDEINKIFGIKK
jgi:regulator of RNase E activity RraA